MSITKVSPYVGVGNGEAVSGFTLFPPMAQVASQILLESLDDLGSQTLRVKVKSVAEEGPFGLEMDERVCSGH